MADRPPKPMTSGPGVRRGRTDQPPPRPRWVNLSVIAAILVMVLFVGLHLTGFVPTHR